ncbi:helix-turn-helix transcriptional regulator [Peribacillus simplex]|uniref:helix-turn-helix transcriptional regulator n=1 Tax=Peribacillus simplex TaxID=1478 RepID=UPI00333736EF
MTYKVGRCLLRHHLTKNRMTQQELAEHIGLSKQTVSRYVNNSHVMSYQTALNIARVLKCQMEDLYEIRE